MLKKPYIFGILIVLVLLVAGGIVLVLQSRGGTDTDSDTNAANTNGSIDTVPYVTDPAQELADADKDGLTDPEEQKLGTNPTVTDTDKDGLSDFDEVRKYHSDPNKAVSGSLKYNDGEAVRKGIDPTTGKELFTPEATANVNS